MLTSWTESSIRLTCAITVLCRRSLRRLLREMPTLRWSHSGSALAMWASRVKLKRSLMRIWTRIGRRWLNLSIQRHFKRSIKGARPIVQAKTSPPSTLDKTDSRLPSKEWKLPNYVLRAAAWFPKTSCTQRQSRPTKWIWPTGPRSSSGDMENCWVEHKGV